jgi:hypothetical protein
MNEQAPQDQPDDSAAVPAGKAGAASGGIWRQQWLALFSLVIALFGLGYNTYRNETSEQQRNVRDAGFYLLQEVSELQQLADTRFFGRDLSARNRIAIWSRVSMARDIAGLVSADAQAQAASLHQTWTLEEPAFDKGDPEAEKRVASTIQALRRQVVVDLMRLD